jgi:hypothetical protein
MALTTLLHFRQENQEPGAPPAQQRAGQGIQGLPIGVVGAPSLLRNVSDTK